MAIHSCPASVLVIEDDESVREALGAFLEARGYAATLAEDGHQALDLLATLSRPCLLLVDLLTPGVDCDNLLAALVPDDRLATLPMVLLPVSAPGFLSRPAIVKRPVDFEIVFRIVKEHCCEGDRGGGKPAAGRDSLPGEGP
jgi:FixJ family two-component response regulator